MSTNAKAKLFGAGKRLAWSIAVTAVCGVVVSVVAWPTLEWWSLLLWVPLLLVWLSTLGAGMAMGLEVANDQFTDKIEAIIDDIER